MLSAWRAIMDFDIVVRQIFKAYKAGSYRWSLDDFVKVFERFYGLYADYMGRGHPHLKTETIGRVMALLTEDVNGVRYSADEYLDSDLFECYFVTAFNPGCDYSIVHFTSGNVRYYKTFEAV